MSVRYYISQELNLVVFICKGAVTGHDLLDALKASLEDPLRLPGMMNILDAIDARDEIDVDDLQHVIELEKKVHKRKEAVKVAVLSFSDGMKALAGAITLMSQGTIEAQGFQELHLATDWLGLADAAAVETFWQTARA